MMIQNPLVPPQSTGPSAAPAPVANAPRAAEAVKPETTRPVVAGTRSAEPQASRNDEPRGQKLDIQV